MNLTSFLARRADRKLGEDLLGHLVRVFADHSARVVENEKLEYQAPRSFDYAVATVATPDLHLRFVRVRGEFAVSVSLPSPHRRWDTLDSALRWSDMQRYGVPRLEVPRWDYGLDWNTLNLVVG